jgi:large subunit ribosomal protein L5e
MPFVKLVKNKPYYMRYQVKFRRRRQGITDYQQRRGLVIQDKNKYNAKKRRLVVRIMNKHVVCQIVNTGVKGDEVLESAYSHELPHFGVKAGLTNYAACYATGLLAARRVLKKFKLDETYKGNDEINGEYFMQEEVEDDDEAPRPLSAFLDVGLARCSTGARIFGCLKGAVDGGLAIPHGENRFPGYDEDEKALDAEVHSNYIHGGHVGEYMDALKEEDQSAFERQFSKFIKAGINSENIEEMYTTAHEKIRANPDRVTPSEPGYSKVVKGRKKRLTKMQRQDKVKQKINSFHFKLDQEAAE